MPSSRWLKRRAFQLGSFIRGLEVVRRELRNWRQTRRSRESDGLLGSGRSDHKNHLLNLFGRVAMAVRLLRPARLVQAAPQLRDCSASNRGSPCLSECCDGSAISRGSLGAFSQARTSPHHANPRHAPAGSFIAALRASSWSLADFLISRPPSDILERRASEYLLFHEHCRPISSMAAAAACSTTHLIALGRLRLRPRRPDIP